MAVSLVPQLTDEECKKRGLLTREEFAGEVGVSVDEIRRRERRGELAPSARGRWSRAFYHPDQVVQQKLRVDMRGPAFLKRGNYTNVEAQQGFRALAAGKGLRELVVDEGIHPIAAREIIQEYHYAETALLIPGNVMELINKLPLTGTLPVTNAQQLYEALKDATDDRCRDCGHGQRAVCKRCARKATIARIRAEEG
jgi:hypothetical protein